MTDLPKLRCGIIGGGAIGHSHVHEFRAHPQAEVIAIAEIDDVRREAFARDLQIAHQYKDYRDLLANKEIDIVSIGLPNYLHADVAVEALNAGKHVLLEKPMATSYADAKRVYDAAVAKGLKVMVGQNQRFAQLNQTMEQIVAEGVLGDVYHAKAAWRRRAGIPRIGSWFTQKKLAGGGCSYDIGVHALDAVLGIINNFEPVSVSAKVYSELGTRGFGNAGWGMSEVDPSKPFDVEDFSFALIRMKNGATVHLESSWAIHQPEPNISHIQLFGTEAGMISDPLQIYHMGRETYVKGTPALRAPKVNTGRLHHFVDVVLGKVEPYVKPEQSLVVQKILDAIYESSRIGKEVVIDS
jgi:predicted dehydrogenase